MSKAVMDAKLMKEFRRRLMEADDVEGALQVLREAGFSKVQSIKALTDSGKFRLAEAKVVVHESGVWEDVRQRDSEFHDALRIEGQKPEPRRRDENTSR